MNSRFCSENSKIRKARIYELGEHIHCAQQCNTAGTRVVRRVDSDPLDSDFLTAKA